MSVRTSTHVLIHVCGTCLYTSADKRTHRPYCAPTQCSYRPPTVFVVWPVIGSDWVCQRRCDELRDEGSRREAELLRSVADERRRTEEVPLAPPQRPRQPCPCHAHATARHAAAHRATPHRATAHRATPPHRAMPGSGDCCGYSTVGLWGGKFAGGEEQ